MFSCEPIEKKEYRLHVVYTNSDEEIVTILVFGDVNLRLNEGDLTESNLVILSGVRSFTVKSIINKGPLTDEEITNENGCLCVAKIVSTEKIIKNEEITE